MKEDFHKIYKNKAFYYLEVIEELEVSNIPFVLLNYIIPDENPGDLDILINEVNLKEIELTLKKRGFNYYTDFTTNQIIWNKYVSNIGFIQFHLYIGLSFTGKQIFPNIPKINLSENGLDFSFFVFLIESFYRKNYKKDIYEKYLKQTSFISLQKFVSLYFPKSIDIVQYTNSVYKSSTSGSAIKYFQILLRNNKHFLLKYYFNKILTVIKRIGNKDDIYVLFLGPDGSGKTTLLNNINSIASKGGYFPTKKYFGLKISIVHKTLNILSRAFKTKKINQSEKRMVNQKNDKITNNSFFNYLKIVAYWIEYNFKFFYELKLKPKSAKTIYLIDRSFVDLLFFYQNNFAEALFMKYSFQPTNVILLSGNATVFYSRNQEYTIEVINKHIKFYNKLDLIYKNNKISSMVLDTSNLDEKQCVSNSLDYFIKK